MRLHFHPLSLVAVASALLAPLAPALAQPAVSPMTVKDGLSASQPLCEFKIDGTNLAGCTVKYVWTGSAFVVEPADSGGREYVDIYSMPNVTLGPGSATIGNIGNTSFGISGTLPAFGATPAVKAQDSAGGDATDTTNHAVRVNCVVGCSSGGGGAVTIAAGAVAANAYALGSILDLGTGGTLHNDLQTLNTTAGAPAKLNDSGGGDVSDATNHALVFEPSFAGRFVQAPVSIASTSATTLVAAQGTGLYTYVTDLDCSNHGQYTFTLTITNSTSTQLYSFDVPAGGGWVKSFATPVGGNGQMATNTALSITASQTTGTGATPSLVCNVQGRVRTN